MSLFKFGKFERDVDFTDPNLIDQIEESETKAIEASKKVPLVGKTSDRIRALSKIYNTFFDEVLGEGSSALLFGDSESYALRIDAYNAFCQSIKDTTKSLYSSSAAQKFMPNKQNRQQRRQKNYWN